MAVTFEDAVKIMIQQWYSEDPTKPESELDKIKPSKYNRQYFKTFATNNNIKEKPLMKGKKNGSASTPDPTAL